MKVMTMNKLDDKVIVDREVLQYMIDQVSIYAKYHDVPDIEEFPLCQRAKQALAADLTGWVAVPVEATEEMQTKGADKIPDVYWGCESVAVDVFTAMLAASPPLPGGGE